MRPSKTLQSGTPGNLGSFEDILFANNEMQDTPVIIALFPNFRENGCTVGLGYVDLTKRILGLAEFLDDSHFTNVESALVALGCKECLFPMESGKSSECRTLGDALTRCGVMVTERKKTEFKERDLVQDLGGLVKGSVEPVRDLISGFEFASGALGALLSYAELLADESNYGNYTIQTYSLDSYMRLDSAAMSALNVLESKTDANKMFAPVTYARWKDLPEDNTKDIWKNVLVRYDVPEKGKRWVMRTFKECWQRFKSRMKTYLYTRYETFEERLANCPDRIPRDDAKIWLEHLEKEDVKAMCLRNKENRKKYKFINRVGPIAYAVLRNEWDLKP